MQDAIFPERKKYVTTKEDRDNFKKNLKQLKHLIMDYLHVLNLFVQNVVFVFMV